MQEEVENRAVNLVISTTKLSLRTVISTGQKYLRHRKDVKQRRRTRRDQRRMEQRQIRRQKEARGPVGKQTVKQLIAQNQGVANIDVARTDLKGFERYARKYGVDYAVRKAKGSPVPKYLVFFKARDKDALTAAFGEYMARTMKMQKKPSVKEQLGKARQKAMQKNRQKAAEKGKGRPSSRQRKVKVRSR